ncbi:MAG: GIY-YIG nuclease family protein [Nitrospirota bacterium]
MPYVVYILKSDATGTSYVGQTSDLEKRLGEHNNGKSLSTRNQRPWRLVYKEVYQTRAEAVRREKHFKSVKGRLELKAQGIL